MIRAHSAQGCYQYWTLHQLYHWLAMLGFEREYEQMRLPQWGLVKLRHASFFNIILKWNWLHLDRHSDKSHQYLAEAGFIAEGQNHHPSRASASHLRFGPALLHDDGASVLLLQTDWEGDLWLGKGLKVLSNILFVWSGVEKDRWYGFTLKGWR